MATVNPWKRFIGLLPGGVRTVATVVSVDLASGTSIVALRNGNQMTARGVDVEPASRAFVLDGDIMGPAPELPQFDVEV